MWHWNTSHTRLCYFKKSGPLGSCKGLLWLLQPKVTAFAVGILKKLRLRISFFFLFQSQIMQKLYDFAGFFFVLLFCGNNKELQGTDVILWNGKKSAAKLANPPMNKTHSINMLICMTFLLLNFVLSISWAYIILQSTNITILFLKRRKTQTYLQLS